MPPLFFLWRVVMWPEPKQSTTQSFSVWPSRAGIFEAIWKNTSAVFFCNTNRLLEAALELCQGCVETGLQHSLSANFFQMCCDTLEDDIIDA